MSKYLVRIELYNATSEDYEKLHESLAAIGCVRYVIADSGKKLKLPDATYSYSGSLTSAYAVAEKVKPIAQSIRNCTLFVCDYTEWYGYLHDA